ncbi:MAG: ribonuclease III [Chloroflexi bacterium]|nr:ribonuclease III [Chloroflexota bacterium]
MTDIDDVQEQIGVQFVNDRLLWQALTHRSYINEHGEAEGDNERLEFLGDAVLDFLVGDMLFQRFPDMPEGHLTRLRSALVRTESLAFLAAEAGLGIHLRMGKGEEAGGGRKRLSNLCAVFEAVTGALYLDQGLEAVRAFILPRVESLIGQVLEEAIDKDARSRLQEWSQAELNKTPAYRTVSATGPDHLKEFVIEVLIGEKVVGRGTGRSKQIAAQAAARDALRSVERGELVV